MATDSMMHEWARRLKYVADVNEEMHQQSSNVTTVAIWPDVRHYDEEGLNPRDAARRFLSLIHEGP